MPVFVLSRVRKGSKEREMIDVEHVVLISDGVV